MTRRPVMGRFRAAFFGTLTLGLVLAALPARGQSAAGQSAPTPSPSSSFSPQPGSSPSPNVVNPATPTFPGEQAPPPTATVRPIVPLPPGSTPQPSIAPIAPSPTPTERPNRIKTRSDAIVNNRREGISTLRGNVHVDYGQVRIDAEEINVDQNKHEIFTDTKFSLDQPDPKTPGQRQVVSGTGLRYNYETEESTVYDANVSTPAEYPGQSIYIRAKKVKGYGQDRFDAEDAIFTTCSDILDEKVPHYHVECRSLQYFAGDRVVAWDNKVYINGRYVFWLPVWVIPLKKEGLNLDIGRNEVEGFYLRSGYNYALPALNDGYFLNQGRLTANLFEKKGVGLGVENTTNWGYAATTYAFFYGLVSPDRGSFLQPNTPDTQEMQDADVKRGEQLFGLNGLPFQDHQWGIEHRQRLIGNMEAGGRIQDDNIYDPLTPNYRVNRRLLKADLKDNITAFNGINYSVSYDSTEQRGTTTRSGATVANQMNDSISDRVAGNTSFRVGNTSMQVNSDFSRNHQRTIELTSAEAAANATSSPDPNNLALITQEQGGNVNVTNNFNATSSWPGNINSTVAVPYRIDFRETPGPLPTLPGSTPPPLPPNVVPTPHPTAIPWNQNIEPAVTVNTHVQNLGTLDLQASKFFDLTQKVVDPKALPLTALQQQSAVRAQGRWDRLPEISLTTDPFLADYQPFSLKLGYGRFFEYSTFKIPNIASFTGTLDRYFPGDYIDRINPEFTLGSKGHDIGLRSKLDFGGSGYRQFFYSTKDQQYSIDERIRLSTDWTDKIQTNFNYINNLTPDPKLYNGGGPGTPTNSSPFNQDKLSTFKQTHLTGDFNINNTPWLTYALRGGYDYINGNYDNLSNSISWFSALPVLQNPFSVRLQADFQPEKDPFKPLKIESKPLDIRYLPKIPLTGIAGTWLPVSGTFVIRSSPDVFGGAFGSDKIVPGWQFDSQLAYDFDKGLWQSLTNRVYFTLGDKWQNHVELVLGGYYDTTPGNLGYKFTTFGINKDLHDAILSFQYDRLSSFYSLSLTMVAFPSKPLNFTSNSFDRTRQTNSLPGLGL